MRDWQKDWELSQQATPEPWEMIILGPYEKPPCGLGTFVANCGSTASFKDVLVVSLGCSSNLDVKGAVEDAQFIAETREALPYWLQRVKALEAEVNEHRERANNIQIAWEGHKAQDCALRCVKELETLLGTNDPVEAACKVRMLQAAVKALLECEWTRRQTTMDESFDDLDIAPDRELYAQAVKLALKAMGGYANE